MTLNLTVTPQLHTDFTPRITVIGVGGGGTNAVDNMIAMNLQGVEFIVANTDAQQLVHSRADRRIQLGPHITQGLGAGAKPEIGQMAAEEAADEIYRHLEGAHMVFVTAGMGGGTGTGAAPVIARMAREKGILTVGVVTKPFTFEGSRRARAAEAGIAELTHVDTLIVIPNQNLFRLANERTGWKEAFKMADNVLYMGVRGVTDLMVAPGMVNLDFADIRTVMGEMGKAMMGTGEAEGENRAVRAAEAAISNPLLEDTCMAGARGLLINITGGDDMTLFEVDQAANRIREEVDEEANIIFGSAIDENSAGRIRVSVAATGIDTPARASARRRSWSSRRHRDRRGSGVRTRRRWGRPSPRPPPPRRRRPRCAATSRRCPRVRRPASRPCRRRRRASRWAARRRPCAQHLSRRRLPHPSWRPSRRSRSSRCATTSRSARSRCRRGRFRPTCRSRCGPRRRSRPARRWKPRPRPSAACSTSSPARSAAPCRWPPPPPSRRCRSGSSRRAMCRSPIRRGAARPRRPGSRSRPSCGASRHDGRLIAAALWRRSIRTGGAAPQLFVRRTFGCKINRLICNSRQ